MTFSAAQKLCFACLCVAFIAGATTGCAGIGGTRSASTQPSDPKWQSQRERELAQLQKEKPLGLWIFSSAWLRMEWVVSDLTDRISGARRRHAAQMAVKDNPDIRQDGIMGSVDRPWGEMPPYTVAYVEIARDTSQDYMVRASAIRALNRARATEFKPVYVQQLSDTNPAVRLEACKALNRMPDAEALSMLLKLATRPEEDKDVRIAAVEALRHYKRLDVARALVGLLGEREFGIAWQARRSLQEITSQKLGYDEAKWLQYLSSPTKPLG